MGEKGYKELQVWQEAMSFVKMVYQAVKPFPREELHALSDQLKRAVVSIPSNIAEGAGRATHAEFIRFLYIARGSLCEVDTQLELAQNLGYCVYSEQLRDQEAKVGRMLNGLIRSLKTSH